MIRKRLDGFSEVVQCWDGPVVCIAGGPSLTREQCEAVRGKARVIAVNDAFKLAPWADALYFADFRWGCEWHRTAVNEFAGHKVSIEQSRPVEWPDDIHILRNLDKGDPTGLSLDPTGLKTGRHSGYQALNLAVLAGGNPILLLGYDYKFSGKAHFFGDHPIPTPENHLTGFRQKFSTIENPLKDMGIEVFNCSPDSALDAFPRMSLEKALLHTLSTTRVAA